MTLDSRYPQPSWVLFLRYFACNVCGNIHMQKLMVVGVAFGERRLSTEGATK